MKSSKRSLKDVSGIPAPKQPTLKSVRLTKEIKRQIRWNYKEAIYEKKAAELREHYKKKAKGLGEKLYRMCISEDMEKRMLEFPNGFFEMRDAAGFSKNDARWYFKELRIAAFLLKERPFPNSQNIMYPANNREWEAEYKKVMAKLDEYTNEVYAAKKAIDEQTDRFEIALEPFTTTSAIRKAWPEVAKFFPDAVIAAEKETLNVNLPAKTYAELNKVLGLPIEEEEASNG